MYHQLVNHNEDILDLIKKGYAVDFDEGYMVIRDIPYLDNNKQLQIGAIVTKLLYINKVKVQMEDHQIFFAGSVPCDIEGAPIPNLGGGNTTLPLSDKFKDVIVQRSFSNKPVKDGKFHPYNNLYEKIESYVAIISGPAMELHEVNPYTYRVVTKDESESFSPFKYCDTLTSRAEIGDLQSLFKNDIVAIIGLGGTGSYVLDYLSRTPIKEIRGFDVDPFHVHNAFRSPGKLDENEFGKSKAEVYNSRYDNFRIGFKCYPKFLDASCYDDLNDVTFAFICVDKGSSRSSIFDLLLTKRIPFIDVGMGLNRNNNSLNGMIRTTYYSVQHGLEQRNKQLSPEIDIEDDLYKTNIQISELNALNACLAVIKYKQLRGFYYEEVPLTHLLFKIGDLKINNDLE